MQGARDFLLPSEVQVVIHHSPCDDGHASAAVFVRCLADHVTLHGMHPQDSLLTESVQTLIQDKCIVLVDIAFSLEEIRSAARWAKKILILDHHITNKTALTGAPIADNVHVMFVMGQAGVQLAWEYCFPNFNIPSCLYYIGLRDVWKHEENYDALMFTTAFTRPDNWHDWCDLINNDDIITEKIVNKGIIIYKYQHSVLKSMMEKVQYSSWRGFRIAMVNVPYPWISDIGKLMCEKDPEKTIAVVWNKQATGPFFVSLRSNDLMGPNIEPIAKEFGGGGHAHSAGLRLDVPPYEVFTDTGVWE